jgi:hypothetical protein
MQIKFVKSASRSFFKRWVGKGNRPVREKELRDDRDEERETHKRIFARLFEKARIDCFRSPLLREEQPGICMLLTMISISSG